MGKRLNILIDGTSIFRKIDGIGRYTINLIETLACKMPNTDFTILGFIDDKHKSSPLPKKSNIKYKYLPFPRKVYQVIYSRLLLIPVDLFIRSKFDYIIYPNFVNFPYIKNIQKINVVHDFAYKDVPDTVEERNRRFLSKRLPASIYESIAVITVSNFTKNRLSEDFDVENIFTIYPIIRREFIENSLRNTDVKKLYGIKNKYILCVGTKEPRKNIPVLVEAFLSLKSSERKGYQLVIAGSKGWGLPGLSVPEESIVLTGYVKDVDLPVLIKKANIFISPSIYEGFGIPPYESLRLNTPTLASDIPPHHEFMKGNGFFKPDIISVKNKLKLAINNTEKNTGSIKTLRDDTEKFIEVLNT